MKKHLLLLLILLLVFPLAAYSSGKKDTPESLAGITVVDADTVKKWLDAGEDMLILDARKANDYESGHIPTAEVYTVPGDLDISDAAIDKSVAQLNETDLAGEDKGLKIVAYCNGAT